MGINNTFSRHLLEERLRLESNDLPIYPPDGQASTLVPSQSPPNQPSAATFR